jgi:hypothetical protein
VADEAHTFSGASERRLTRGRVVSV